MPGANVVPSGTLTSETNWARSQAFGWTVPVWVGVTVGGVPVTVGGTAWGPSTDLKGVRNVTNDRGSATAKASGPSAVSADPSGDAGGGDLWISYFHLSRT